MIAATVDPERNHSPVKEGRATRVESPLGCSEQFWVLEKPADKRKAVKANEGTLSHILITSTNDRYLE